MGKAGRRLIKAAQQASATVRGKKKPGTQDEVEITPAMLAAGVACFPLGAYFDSEEDAVAAIYEAMVLAGRGR